jgi:hypothetical protein
VVTTKIQKEQHHGKTNKKKKKNSFFLNLYIVIFSKTCPGGTYSSTIGSTSCVSCPQGSYSTANSTSW